MGYTILSFPFFMYRYPSRVPLAESFNICPNVSPLCVQTSYNEREFLQDILKLKSLSCFSKIGRISRNYYLHRQSVIF